MPRRKSIQKQVIEIVGVSGFAALRDSGFVVLHRRDIESLVDAVADNGTPAPPAPPPPPKPAVSLAGTNPPEEAKHKRGIFAPSPAGTDRPESRPESDAPAHENNEQGGF